MHLSSKADKTGVDVWQQLGEQSLAPLMYDFAWWLHRQAKRDGVGQLLFLARDGYMLQRAYQAVIPEREQLPNRYMLASRRLYNFAAIRRLDEAALRFLLGDRVEMPVRSYLERIGLEAEGLAGRVGEYGFGSIDEIVRGHGFGRLRALFVGLEREILEAAAAERTRLVEYADSLADWDGLKPAVVDIGWHGSMQVSLREVLDLPLGYLKGYYFGLQAGTRARKQGEAMAAYLDEERLGDLLTCWRTFRRSREVFEIFFSDSEGSTVGLERVDGGFAPVREPNQLPVELKQNIERLQSAAMAHLDQAVVPRREVLRRLRRLLSWPTLAEAEALGEVPHIEGIGGYGRMARLARPQYPLAGYWTRLDKLLWDWRKTFWRPGFVRRLWH